MAVRTPTYVTQNNGVIVVTWAGLLEVGSVKDTGLGVSLPPCTEICVQATGNFDTAAVVTMQGSNDGGTTWSTIGSGTLIAATVFRTIAERPLLIRPAVTTDGSGDATNVTVILVASPR